ncbi:MAG TPA: tetratricopeptide repeat protein [Bacteroidota bacterium]
MAHILPFTPKPAAKIGFQRVQKKQKSGEAQNQLPLFGGAGRILHLPDTMSPFDKALLLDEGGDERAAKFYQQAINAGESVADAYCNLGILESKAGRTARAFDCFTRSLKEDPRHLESQYNLGNQYFEAGDLNLAKTHFQIAVEIDPDFPNAYFNLGLIHAINNDISAAAESIRRYAELVPEGESTKARELLTVLQRTLKAKG